jgi:DNA repair protein RadB
VSERVSTGCGPLDELLNGGLERGATTQLYGPPAAGKTNVALSAAIETAAAGGSALFIDTEGVSPDRLHQLLDARASESEDSPEAIAERVIVADAMDFDEQEAAVQDAADVASRVDLIVLDSATGFYRLARDPADEGEALRRVGRQLTHLLSLARKHDLAVLLTNQVFTDPDTDRTRALGGHTLDHWSGAIIRIERFRGGNRRATLEKHRSLPAGETAEFRITDAGIEGTAERTRSR